MLKMSDDKVGTMFPSLILNKLKYFLFYGYWSNSFADLTAPKS